jgi:cystathionine beta-lyase/cystathionine gamma-synthase
MASTAYGGSSELTDLLSARSAFFNKSTFDITGTRDLAASIKESLDALAAAPAKLMPTTVLFVEIPTNPDMKVPDILVLAKICSNYKK